MADLERLRGAYRSSMRRDLLLLTRVVLVVMLTVFSIASRNASAHDMPLQGNAQGAMPQSLQEKMQRLRALVERLQQQEVDLQPVGDVMQGFQPRVEEKKFSEAEALVDRALKLLEKPSTPASPPGTGRE